jgi:hypothetical protein
MAPKSLATLPRSLTENVSAIEERDIARANDPNYKPTLSPEEYAQKLQAFIEAQSLQGAPPFNCSRAARVSAKGGHT